MRSVKPPQKKEIARIVVAQCKSQRHGNGTNQPDAIAGKDVTMCMKNALPAKKRRITHIKASLQSGAPTSKKAITSDHTDN